MDIETIIYNALAPFGATNTLAEHADTPYVVFATQVDSQRDRAGDIFRQDAQLLVTIVADTFDQADALGEQIVNAVSASPLLLSRHGFETSVIDEKFVRDINFTLIKI